MTDTLEVPKRKVGPQHTDGRKPDVDAAVEALDGMIERLLNEPGAFREYLKYSGAMHSYSMYNMLLIMVDAYRRQQQDIAAAETGADVDPERWDRSLLTMGFHGWKNMGRMVRKGSKAIALLAPVIINVKDDETGEKRTKLIGFKIIHKTFHVQDTDGPDFEPMVPIPPDANGENEKNMCRVLSKVALNDCGVSAIKRDDEHDTKLGKAHGCYVPSTGEVWIKSTNSYAHAAKTLIHEMAHCVAEHGKAINYQQQRAACEAIAEGVAFVVMEHYGYDTADYSVPYIAQWTGDTDTVKQCLKDISDVSKLIITKVDAARS